MKNVEIITSIAIAVGAASLLYYLSKPKGKKQSSVSVTESLAATGNTMSEAPKYSNGLLKEYDIVIPHAYPSKSVKEKAEQVSKDRHAINPKKRQYPIFLHEL
jgi:hypothetical protein